MHELPRQLSVDELAELFEGRTRLVERLAETEDPLGRADEVLATLSDDEKVEAFGSASRRSASATGCRHGRQRSRARTPTLQSSPISRT